MNRLTCALAALTLVAATAGAADYTPPAQKIVGADEPVPAGELVILSPSKVDSPPANLVATSYSWVVIEDGKVKKRVRAFDDGSIDFGAGLVPKTMTVLLNVAYYFEDRDGALIKDRKLVMKTITAQVQVVAAGPAPTPNPDPNPPTPPPSDGKYGLAKFVYQVVTEKVSSPNRAREAQALAKSFRDIAKSVADGSFASDRDVIQQTKQANDKILGEALPQWAALPEAVVQQLESLFDAGKLRSLQEYATAWNEIADGLERVR